MTEAGKLAERCLKALLGPTTQVSEVAATEALSPSEIRFFGLSGGKGLRWIIPDDREAALNILKEWRPYGLKTQIAWKALLLALHTPFWRLVFDQTAFRCLPPSGSCTFKAMHHPLSTVIYIGTDGPRRKAVCNLLDEADPNIRKIMKIPLGEDAVSATYQEVGMLRTLAEANKLEVPRVIRHDVQSGISVQTALVGQPSGRKLTNAHINFLIGLRRGDSISVQEWKANITEAISDLAWPTPAERGKIDGLLTRLDSGRRFPAVIRHGDFAPWNVRISGEACAVYDWEDGSPIGLPLLDAIHFIAIQAHLFGKRHSLARLIHTDPVIKVYCMAMSLDDVSVADLLRAYVLEIVARPTFGPTHKFGRYLLSQQS